MSPSTNVVDNSGARNEAFRSAARAHGLPEDWLVAVGYQQGRFEAADAPDADADVPTQDPASSLMADTPVDETDGTADDGSPVGDDDQMPPAFGVMFLSDDQIQQAAALTGHDAIGIRSDVALNIDAAATLIAQGWDGSDAGLRAQTVAFLGANDDVDTQQLALDALDGVIANGFDVTTSDGEHLQLVGADSGITELAAPKPGHYPAIQWIPSPTFSSRLGYSIRYVAIHDIEGTMAGAIAVFKNKANQASAHYIVRSRDGHVVQMVHEADNAWHVGHAWFNRHSIGIEHEGFAHKKNGGGFYTDTLYTASAQLTCALVHKYGIPVDRKHIFGHFNVPSNLSSHTLCSDARGIAGECGGVNHHSDPGKYWNWAKYMKLVSTCVKAAG